MHLVIVGNGITGVTAALTVRRLLPAARISLVSSESAYHISRPALMYVYMGQLRAQDLRPYPDHFWAENRLELVQAHATGLDPGRRQLSLDNGQALAYDQLLLATGSRGRRGGWPGQDLAGVGSLYTLPDLAALVRDTPGLRQAVVAGGGLVGIELAEMLHSRGIETTLLVRESHFWAAVLPAPEAALVARRLAAHGIALRTGTEVAAVLPDVAGRVRAVRPTAGPELPCQWLGVAIGAQPNTDLARAAGLAVARGIVVDEYLQTSAPGVFAAGDCAEPPGAAPGTTAVEQLWYTGRMQGETVGHTLAGQPRPYRRGPGFNSAKFLDLEYQSYGQVPARPDPARPTRYWEHPTGRHALRLAHDASGAILGVHTLGLRQRQSVWEGWLRARLPVAEVLRRLPEANFDPELFNRYEKEMVAKLGG